MKRHIEAEDVQLVLEMAKEFPDANTEEIAASINNANAQCHYFTLKRHHVRRNLEALLG